MYSDCACTVSCVGLTPAAADVVRGGGCPGSDHAPPGLGRALDRPVLVGRGRRLQEQRNPPGRQWRRRVGKG